VVFRGQRKCLREFFDGACVIVAFLKYLAEREIDLPVIFLEFERLFEIDDSVVLHVAFRLFIIGHGKLEIRVRIPVVQRYGLLRNFDDLFVLDAAVLEFAGIYVFKAPVGIYVLRVEFDRLGKCLYGGFAPGYVALRVFRVESIQSGCVSEISVGVVRIGFDDGLKFLYDSVVHDLFFGIIGV